MAKLEGATTVGNSDAIEEPILAEAGMQFNAPHFLLKTTEEIGQTSQSKIEEKLFSLIITDENKNEKTKEFDALSKQIFVKTNGYQWEYEGAKVIYSDEDMVISTKCFLKGIKKKKETLLQKTDSNKGQFLN